MFMQFLGYDISFGHTQAALLMNTKKYTEKAAAYMFISKKQTLRLAMLMPFRSDCD